MLPHGLLDFDQEAVALAQHERLGELVARAELLVERLAADPGGGRDIGHRDLRPGAALQLAVGGVEQRVAQQLTRGERVGGALASALISPSGSVRLERVGDACSAGLEVDLVAHAAVRAGPLIGHLTPAVPAGKPSRG